MYTTKGSRATGFERVFAVELTPTGVCQPRQRLVRTKAKTPLSTWWTKASTPVSYHINSDQPFSNGWQFAVAVSTREATARRLWTKVHTSTDVSKICVAAYEQVNTHCGLCNRALVVRRATWQPRRSAQSSSDGQTL